MRRSSCRRDTAPSGEQGFLTRFTCQNVTMAQFAEWFSNHGIGPGILGEQNWLRWISDGTGLSGGWDFTLVYDPVERMALPGDQSTAAADPGGGYTIFEAMQRQLGVGLVTISETRAGYRSSIISSRKPTEQ